MSDAWFSGMMFRYPLTPAVCMATACVAMLTAPMAHAADAGSSAEMEALQKRNAALEELVRKQATVIENLNQRVTAIESVEAKRAEAADNAPVAMDSAPKSGGGFNLGRVNITGEG